MPETIEIREATSEDAALVVGFVRDLAAFERLSHEVVATEADFARALAGPDPAAHALVATLDGTPSGFALWFPTFSTFLGRRGIWLEDLYVRPELRGRGVGKALLAHLAAIAVEHGFGRLEWSVLDWNEEAIRFYRAIGAEPLEEWTTFRLTGSALGRFAD